MQRPASTGPKKLEVEKPADSQLKLAARFSAVLTVPTAYCTAMCTQVKPVPNKTTEAYSTAMPGTSAGKPQPRRMPAHPSAMGLAKPARSVKRPRGTASHMGKKAIRPTSRPTENSDPCSESA